MSVAYNQMYLNDAITNMGEMTEYAHYACNVDLDRTFSCFIISGYAKRFQMGDPQVVSGMSGTELYMAVMDKCGMGRDSYPDPLVRYETDVFYWIGYILAYAQWLSGWSFKSITDAVKTEDFMRMYPALHTVSEDRACEEILELCKKRAVISRLQQYEVGDKDIAKASAGSVISLAKTLHVEPGDLII